jgi:hypothetical protein
MSADVAERMAHARTCLGDDLAALVQDASEEVVAEALENPRLNEQHLLLLLERKGLSGRLLERVATQREWLRSYPVKKAVAIHPRTPRRLALPLLRQFYLFDLVDASIQPATPAELKRLAEEMIIGRLAQLPLGQKMTLAKRGSARVAGALLAEGHPQVFPLALNNSFLTEAQVLKTLACEHMPEEVAAAIARHRKWSLLYNVRMALAHNPATPLARVLAFLPDLTLRDLKDLSRARTIDPRLRQYLEHEVARRAGLRRRSGTRG